MVKTADHKLFHDWSTMVRPKIIKSLPVVVNRSDVKIISFSQRQGNIFSSFLNVPVTRPRSPPRHASKLEISEIDKVYNLFSKFCPEVRDAQNYTCALVRHWIVMSYKFKLHLEYKRADQGHLQFFCPHTDLLPGWNVLRKTEHFSDCIPKLKNW